MKKQELKNKLELIRANKVRNAKHIERANGDYLEFLLNEDKNLSNQYAKVSEELRSL